MPNKSLVIAILLPLAFSCHTLRAQVDNTQKEFEKFRQQQLTDFNDFRSKADAEYEAFLRQAWEKYEAFAGIPAPTRPEPPEPVTYEEPATPPEPVTVTPKEPEPEPEPQPDVEEPVAEPEQAPGGEPAKKPLSPISDKPIPGRIPGSKPYTPTIRPVPPMSPSEKLAPRMDFFFYGLSLELAAGVAQDLKLAGNSEANVADAWKSLCQADHALLVSDCMRAKQTYRMNDWMYVMLTQKVAESLYGPEQTDEIAFLQMFLLVKSGYKARLARVNEQLKLLMPSNSVIYATPYINIDDTRYYIINPDSSGSMSIYTYRNNFADANDLVTIAINELPDFLLDESDRSLSPRSGDFTVNTRVNKNLIDFYNDYPQCDVDVHFHAPMSSELKQSLYPTLEAAIAGRSQEEAANILLNFVQTAFEYKTDGDQFGYEKPNFFEETFFYPYCDCEDRSMLYATLVRDLIGLDVILLDYPGHIATAVKFPSTVKGDRVELQDGSSYLICDPTYIGAPIGMCMDDYRSVGPGIIF